MTALSGGAWEETAKRAELKAAIVGGVQGILAAVLGAPLSEVALDRDLEADLGMDSLKMIETNVELEARFGFVSPDVARPEELQIRTVEDLVGYVADQVLARKGASQ
jgi:acyl carrier protein